MRRIIKVSIAVLVLVIGFSFGFKIASAQLPVEAGFGQSCGAGVTCQYPFYCGGDSKCIECSSDSLCSDHLPNSTCKGYICTLPGGNDTGGFCAGDSNCKSGLKCGTRGTCGEAGAGGTGGEGNWMGIDLTIQDVADIINGIACWLTRIATAVMVIFLVIAGMRFMYARGNPTAYQTAVKNFQHVLIGILVIMAVYVIIATVAHAVGRTDFSLIPLVC